jgi:hypothetical protein
MEWIIGIIFACLTLYFIGGSASKASSSKKSKAAVVKDFIDEERIYTEEDAVYTVQQFVLALGDTEDFNHTSRADLLAQSFLRLLELLRNEYQSQITSDEEEIVELSEHCEEQITDVKSDPDLEEGEKKDQIAGLKMELKEDIKQPKRSMKFCEKQISSINENPKQILKKTLEIMKKQHKEGNPLMDLDDAHYLMDLVKYGP